MTVTTPTSPAAGEPSGAAPARPAMGASDLAVIEELMSGGELLPSQLPTVSHWSPEKRLAAAVLASALIEIRDHHGSRAHRRRVTEALEWVAAEDGGWPFSFVRLCELFSLEVAWVREAVRRWIATPIGDRKAVPFLYRHAA